MLTRSWRRWAVALLFIGFLAAAVLWVLAPSTPSYVRSVCYWKTAQKELIESTEQLDNIGCKTVYVKYFDASLDPNEAPQATAYFNADTGQTRKFGAHFTVIPCVFLSISASGYMHDVEVLAYRIATRVLAMHRAEYNTKPSRVLIDFDWTDRTRDAYFQILERIKKYLPSVSVECSMRLWQYKDRQQNIPPVARILLMCYNMGTPTAYNAGNSIASLAEIKKYISKENASTYPLEVDIALPAFSWAVAFWQGSFKGLFEGCTHNDFRDTSTFTRKSNGMYRLRRDEYVGSGYFSEGAEFRVDQLDVDEVHEIARYATSVLPLSSTRTVTIFSWKQETLEQFGLDGWAGMYP